MRRVSEQKGDMTEEELSPETRQFGKLRGWKPISSACKPGRYCIKRLVNAGFSNPCVPNEKSLT